MRPDGAEDVAEVLEFGRRLHLDHYGSRLPFGVLGGSGNRQTLLDLETGGEPFEVIDASGGYGSACLGAGHPVIEEAAAHAIRTSGYATDEVASLERARLLTFLFGRDGLWSDHFDSDAYHVSGRSSGTEAIELALRLVLESRYDRRRARPHPDRAARDVILAFEGAWHGWSHGLVSLLNRRHYRAGLPLPTTDGAFGITVDHIAFGDQERLASYFAAQGERVLAVVVEPVQGDAGVLVPPPGYLRSLSDMCRRAGALLVADEVLTFAKTGSFFAMRDDLGPIETDITAIGKSLGMGVMPLSMVIARRSLTVRSSGAVATNDLRPLACAVARAGLGFIADADLLEASCRLGQTLSGLLREKLVDGFPELYSDTRGMGAIHGVELTERAADRIGDLRRGTIREGVYVEVMAGAGPRSGGLPYVYPVLRIAPPLTTGEGDLHELVDSMTRASTTFRDTL